MYNKDMQQCPTKDRSKQWRLEKSALQNVLISFVKLKDTHKILPNYKSIHPTLLETFQFETQMSQNFMVG